MSARASRIRCLRRAIVECRDKLPAKPREVLDARLASAGADDDLTLAEALGMRLNTFLQNFSRARKLLAECLGKRGIAVDQELV
jgi:DNA-directed RNA polymerase specialized sigma24 family protein